MKFLFDGDPAARATILLAHGAGAAMDTPWMAAVAGKLAERGLRVARFEFAYMAGRRSGGSKRPPPKVTLLAAEYRAAIAALPGAAKMAETIGLLAIFHTRACSRPPDPTTRTFM